MHVFVLTRVFKMHVFVWENSESASQPITVRHFTGSDACHIITRSNALYGFFSFSCFVPGILAKNYIQTFKSKIYYSKSCEQERTV